MTLAARAVLLFSLLIAVVGCGCVDADPYIRIQAAPLCVQVPTERVECPNNPACGVCKVASGALLEVPEDGCQVPEAFGVTLCVSDCSICDE